MGLINTQRPLIMFVDAGDTLIDVPQFLFYLQTINDNPSLYMSTPPHLEENNDGIITVDSANNRLHGKIYRRSFLEQYNIIFNPNYPRSNEDIGFNLAARLILEYLFELEQIPHCLTYDIPIINWRNDANSLTRLNDCAFYYKENSMGLAQNTLFAVKIAQANNVSFNLIEQLIYRTILGIYNFYYSAKNCRPEFLQDNLNGAIYMAKYLLPIIECDQEKLIAAWQAEMRNIFGSTDWDPFMLEIPDMNLYEWLNYVIKEALKDEYKYI